MIRQAAAVVVALCLSTLPLYAQNTPNTTVKLTVSQASAAVHKSPSVGSPVIGTAPRGTSLVVTREVGDWVKVSWPSADDGAGYVRVSAGTLTRGDAAAAVDSKATAKAAPAKRTPSAAGSKATTAKAAPAGAKTAATATPVPVGAKAVATPAPAPAPAPEPIAARTVQVPTTRPSAPSPARTLYVAPTHIFGVGVMAGGSTMGFGGGARAWKKGRLGLQLEASRYSYDSVDMLSRATSTDIAPGLLFAINDRVSDSLWLRPYVGIAGHFVHSSRRDLIFTDVTESANTLGARVFLGAEMSLASVPQFAVSADAGYYRLPNPFVGLEPGGMGFSISGHWYVK
jgi:hypothetical protein